MQNLDDTILMTVNSLVEHNSKSALSLIVKKSILDRVNYANNRIGEIVSRAYYWFSLPLLVEIESDSISFELFNGMAKFEIFKYDLNYPPPEEIKDRLVTEILNCLEKEKFRIIFSPVRGTYKYSLRKREDKDRFISRLSSLGYNLIVQENDK